MDPFLRRSPPPTPPPPPPPPARLDAAAAAAKFRAAVTGARTTLTDGALAQAAVVALLLPLDAVKTRLQVMPAAARPTAVAARLGAAGHWYGGLVPAVAGALPYGALTFGTYEVAKEVLAERAPRLPRRRRLVAAAVLADAVGGLWLAPAENIKQKVQTGVYADAASAVRIMARTGGVSAFYQGYGALLARDLPARACQLAVYEAIKGRLTARAAAAAADGSGSAAGTSAPRPSPPAPLRPAVALAVGAASGAIAGAATAPLDALKTRMMAQRGGPANLYANVVHAAIQSVRVDGPAALWRGVLPRTVYAAASAACFFGAYEAVKRLHAAGAGAAAAAARGGGGGGGGGGAPRGGAGGG
ncbi:hypothetical protein BU14_0152s0053, partial [Porphyra umbilicalis]